jgi:hypothetical protein
MNNALQLQAQAFRRRSCKESEAAPRYLHRLCARQAMQYTMIATGRYSGTGSPTTTTRTTHTATYHMLPPRQKPPPRPHGALGGSIGRPPTVNRSPRAVRPRKPCGSASAGEPGPRPPGTRVAVVPTSNVERGCTRCVTQIHSVSTHIVRSRASTHARSGLSCASVRSREAQKCSLGAPHGASPA